MFSARPVGARESGGLMVDATQRREADGATPWPVDGATEDGFVNGAPDETDDIKDILDVGLGGLGKSKPTSARG